MPESSLRLRSYRAGRLLTLAAGLTAGTGVLAQMTQHAELCGVFVAGCAALLVITMAVQFQEARRLTRLQAGWQRAAELAELSTPLIGAFAMAIDAKAQHAQGHTERVRELALLIGRELGVPRDGLEALSMAAVLRDVGTLAIPDHVLSKPDGLTEDELKKIQTHTLIGSALLEPVPFPWLVVPIIRSHHEWYDGTGYPDRLSGQAIPLGARILAVADVYDSLLSDRPHRAALQVGEAVQFLRQHSGSQFDPHVLDAGLRALAVSRVDEPIFIYAGGNAVPPAPAADPEPRQVYHHIQQASRETLALYETVQAVSRSLGVRETLESVIRGTRETMAADTCALFLRQEGDTLLAAAASGAFADRIEGQRLPLGRGLSGAVAQSGLPSAPGRLAQDDLDLLAGGNVWGRPLVHALSAPLVDELGALGALTLYRSGDAAFTEDDARLLATVAAQATVAVSNAREYEQTRESALTDGLTGLANARCFRLRLDQELSRARQEKQPLSLIAIDLDGLKYVNDTHGHQSGDRVLCTIAEVFRCHVREADTVVRYAGDEFFIIAPGVPSRQILDVQCHLKAAVRATSVQVAPGERINLSASFGAATFPGDAQQAESLIAAADAAMYADKRLSRQAALLRAGAGRAGAHPVEPVEAAAARAATPKEAEGGDEKQA